MHISFGFERALDFHEASSYDLQRLSHSRRNRIARVATVLPALPGGGAKCKSKHKLARFVPHLVPKGVSHYWKVYWWYFTPQRVSSSTRDSF